MKGFDPIIFEWEGESYAVPATRQMELIARVEDGLIAGGAEQAFEVLTRKSGPPMARVARVYADALSYAGAAVEQIEVFRALTADMRGSGELFRTVQIKLLEVLGVLASDEVKTPKKDQATGQEAG